MVGIINYIFKNNTGLAVIKYLILGFLYQVFKRTTHSVISHKIFNGKQLFLYPTCNISTMFMYTDIPDKNELLHIRDLIKNSDKSVMFLDIGANIGSYSVAVMDICNDVIAFEPHPYTNMRCKMNFLLNGVSEKCVKNFALSNKSGKIKFSDFGGSSTVNHIVDEDSQNGIEVEVSTLDLFWEDSSNCQNFNYVLKVDVEGFEKQVFEGGEKFLKDGAVIGIIFECFDDNEVFDLLNSYGYLDIKRLSANNFLAKK
ncbi:FkbM family methyltransferase [Methylophaga thalassica]|uniref:FkbM family methyltransferase n=1 Tax=Methylophaga aminisulfidivorans TaxID=230105 RepID=UPI003A8F3199